MKKKERHSLTRTLSVNWYKTNRRKDCSAVEYDVVWTQSVHSTKVTKEHWKVQNVVGMQETAWLEHSSRRNCLLGGAIEVTGEERKMGKTDATSWEY